MAYALEVQAVSLRLNDRKIFNDLSFRLAAGESYLMLGAGGSGKTLLLKLCADLLTPEKGKVIMEGVDLASAAKEVLQTLRPKIGFVFQDSALISNMAVFDNVALPLRYHQRWNPREIRARVEEKMALFGVDRAFDRSLPSQLSQDMRKRVALARALALEPRLLFLDEPTGGLGPQAAREISRILRDYQKKVGASILEVTGESPSFIPPVDRVGLLKGGRVAAEGTVEEMRAYLDKAAIAGIHS